MKTINNKSSYMITIKVLERTRHPWATRQSISKKVSNRMLLDAWCTCFIIGSRHPFLLAISAQLGHPVFEICFFLLFLTKTKQDQALPSHVHWKFCFLSSSSILLVTFLGHPVHIAWFQNKFGFLTLNGNKVDVGGIGEKMRSWFAKYPII